MQFSYFLKGHKPVVEVAVGLCFLAIVTFKSTTSV